MKFPFDHQENIAIDTVRMEEAFNVAAGRVVEVEDADYVFVGRGHTVLHNSDIGRTAFSWQVATVSLTGENVAYLLHWTDNVTSDWGEWFDSSEEAFARLGHLTYAVYSEDVVIPLGQFHIQYVRRNT